MNRPADKKGKTPHRGLPAVLAVLWVSLGFQPCALAAAGDSGCPHGTEAPVQAMDADHARGHGHGQTPAAPDCDSAGTSCCEADAGAPGARTATLKADDGGEPDALPPPVGFDLMPRQSEPPERHGKLPLPPERTRPLHVLYCVYLD